jgi:hypothetical protein
MMASSSRASLLRALFRLPLVTLLGYKYCVDFSIVLLANSLHTIARRNRIRRPILSACSAQKHSVLVNTLKLFIVNLDRNAW